MSTLAQLNRPGLSGKLDPARTKIVIRRLPPSLPEEIFWTSVGTWVSEDTASWKQYIAGRVGDEHDGHAVFSRAYVLFKTPEAVVEFRQAYDGHVFRSKTGEEYQAVVEYSPIQRTPLSAKVKVDGRQGTIEQDPDYLSFLESLKMPVEKVAIEVSAPIAQPTSTPLLDHLRTHGGKGGRGSKGKTTASSSDARGRAIASVTAAAAKRAPHADNGPILVAGKGREVSIQESAPSHSAQSTGKKERKKREKGPKPTAATDTTAPATHASTSQTQDTNAAHQPLPPRPPKSAKPRNERGPQEGQAPAARAPRIDGEVDGRPQRRPKREDASGIEVESGGGGRGGGRGRGGRGGRRGGGADRGDGEGKDNSARGAVVSILTRNSEPGEGRGGRGGGRGRGRGGGPAAAGAAIARIDN